MDLPYTFKGDGNETEMHLNPGMNVEGAYCSSHPLFHLSVIFIVIVTISLPNPNSTSCYDNFPCSIHPTEFW